MGRSVDDKLLKYVHTQAHDLRQTVASLDGSRMSLTFPERALKATKQRCSFNADLFDAEAWQPICDDRWRSGDHNALGEMRAVIKFLDALLLVPGAHRSKVLSQQDSMVTAAASNKARSPAGALDYILRRKAGRVLAGAMRLSLPWCETSNMPADWLSRLRAVP